MWLNPHQTVEMHGYVATATDVVSAAFTVVVAAAVAVVVVVVSIAVVDSAVDSAVAVSVEMAVAAVVVVVGSSVVVVVQDLKKKFELVIVLRSEGALHTSHSDTVCLYVLF